jgi:hypothetical protein
MRDGVLVIDDVIVDRGRTPEVMAATVDWFRKVTMKNGYQGHGYRVEFSEEVIESMHRAFADHVLDGRVRMGSLVGSYSHDCKVARVSGLVGVVAGDASGVDRDPYQATVLLLQIWNESKGQVYFLGDWHSHAGRSKLPHDDDWIVAISTAQSEDANCPEFIMAISGDDGLSVHIATRDGGTFQLLPDVDTIEFKGSFEDRTPTEPSIPLHHAVPSTNPPEAK